ncbi:hypothetical protein ACFHPP_16415, partial [Falsiroseomonas sp. E2-1-a20]
MVAELREVERRREALHAGSAATATPEPVPDKHPDLPALNRRRVEALEEALGDPATVGPATEALRSLVDAILVIPGERRGEVSLTLRGDLAALLDAKSSDTSQLDALRQNGKTPIRMVANRDSEGLLGT